MNLAERMRPKTWSEYIGQPRAVAMARRIVEGPGFDGGAFYITGPSGLGKSTLANLILGQTCDPNCIISLNGRRCNAETVDDARRSLQLSTFTGQCRGVLIEEAHAMTSYAVQEWLTALEPMPTRAVVCFTTTVDSEDWLGEFARPFLRRCYPIKLTNQGLAAAFAPVLKRVAMENGLDGQPESGYVQLMKRCGNCPSDCYRAIELGEMASEGGR